mgnify:FL=1
MQTLKKGSSGKDVEQLQSLLMERGYEIEADGIFGKATEEAVRREQEKGGIAADGIVGQRTWELLTGGGEAPWRLTAADYAHAAEMLGVETAAIRAVLEVETGNKGGFLAQGKPTILFEGHVFWKQLSQHGIDPARWQKGNEDILYQKWTKEHYKGGMKEYDRLERARAIHREAADSSASWGLAQIMGFNHAVCGCRSVGEFVAAMEESEGKQLELFVRFIEGNKWDKYLRALDWKEFARHYNGPSYAQNQYDKRLAAAYEKYR